VVGHSFGGLLAQMVAGEGLAAATVVIEPAPFRGVLPLPVSALRSALPVLGNPLNRRKAITLTYEQFRYGWTNAIADEEQSRRLYDTHHVACSGRPLFQAATANLNPATECKVDTRNRNRGPLLIISGGSDHTVPWAIANAAYKKQRRNEAVTEITVAENRGHSLPIDDGWEEPAGTALSFLKRFVA
jgi:pimeloyl-ACP methyl ester carboxylesterase